MRNGYRYFRKRRKCFPNIRIFGGAFCSQQSFRMHFDFLQKRREKGRIDLNAVYSVESTIINLLRDDKGVVPQGYECPFLLGYQHQGDDYVLHLVVKTDEDRLVWICKLRKGK